MFTAMAVIPFLVLGIKVVHQIFDGYYKESWHITEWLINYEGGFVRRGLLGELLLQSHKNLGLNPYYTIVVLSFFLYLTLALFFIRSFRRTGLSLVVLPCAFFMGGPAISNEWVRKDVLLVLLFIGMVRLALSNSYKRVLAVNLLFIVALLVHESIGFWAFPMMIMLLYHGILGRVGSRNKAIALSLLLLSPAMLTFLMVLYHKGNIEVASAIWESWSAVSFPFQSYHDGIAPPAAIGGISWSLEKGVSYTRGLLSNFNDGIYGPLAWLFMLGATFAVTVNVGALKTVSVHQHEHIEDRDLLCSLLSLQLLSITPLFILGIDYGRWVFFWVTSTFSIYLLVPHAVLRDIFPTWVFGYSAKVTGCLDALIGRSKRTLYVMILFIGIPACGWSMGDYYKSTFIYLLLEFGTKMVKFAMWILG